MFTLISGHKLKRMQAKLSDQELFRLIDRAVHKERLYTNPKLQRQDIMRRFGLRRQHLNAILNRYAYGQGFPGYINSIRLNEAERLMKEMPEMTITAIAESVGLSLPNFRIQFRNRYGYNPAEYRHSLEVTTNKTNKSI